MAQISDPTQIDHPQLRELAVEAVWIARVGDVVTELESLRSDQSDKERVDGGPQDDGPREANPIAEALHLVQTAHAEGERRLDERVAAWLWENPEHWPLFSFALIHPWQDPPGEWKRDTPGWIRTLGDIAAVGHARYEQFGRHGDII